MYIRYPAGHEEKKVSHATVKAGESLDCGVFTAWPWRCREGTDWIRGLFYGGS